MAKSPAFAIRLDETGLVVRYQVVVFDPERRSVGEVSIPRDGNEEGIQVDGDDMTSLTARPLVGKILRAHLRDGTWPAQVRHIS